MHGAPQFIYAGRRRAGDHSRGGPTGRKLWVAESGTDMRRFGTASRLSAWTGVAPGHDESAGKQRSGKTRKGNRTLRMGLTQIAHAAARTKGTYVSALYQRLAARRGKKRAIMAVAHAIVVSTFHMLSRHEPYRELGANYFDAHRRDHLIDRLTRRIQHLGYRVHMNPCSARNKSFSMKYRLWRGLQTSRLVKLIVFVEDNAKHLAVPCTIPAVGDVERVVPNGHRRGHP
jgi:hypothetical protein